MDETASQPRSEELRVPASDGDAGQFDVGIFILFAVVLVLMAISNFWLRRRAQ